MKLNRWSLWEFIIARLAKAHGFLGFVQRGQVFEFE